MGDATYDLGYLLPHGPRMIVWCAIGIVEELTSELTTYQSKGYNWLRLSRVRVNPKVQFMPIVPLTNNQKDQLAAEVLTF